MSAKILLCEDDEFLRSGLEEMLQKEGYAACTANLWLKIRKEMKHSVIDNIREL